MDRGDHRLRPRDRGGDEDGEADRRRQEGQRPEIEDEHVTGELVDPHLDERRADQDHQDDIGRGDRHPHAQNDAAEGREQQQQPDIAAGNGDEMLRERRAEAGQAEASDDQTGHRAHDRHEDGRLAGLGKHVDVTAQALAHLRDRHRQDEGREGAGKCRRGGAPVQREQRVEQNRKGQDHRHDAAQRLPKVWQVARLGAGHAVLGGLEIDLQIQAEIEQQRRQRRGDGDAAIGNPEEFRHQEAGRSHHRRQDQPARRRDRLDSRRLLGGIADAAHHRNRQDTGRGDIGRCAARQRTEQRARQDRHLRGAAPALAHQREGEIRNRVAAADQEQDLPEQHEAGDDRRGHVERRSENRAGAQIVVGQQPVPADDAGLEHAGQEMPEIGIGERDQADRDHAPARLPAGRLEQEESADGAGDHLVCGDDAERTDEIAVVEEDVAADRQRRQGADDVVPRHARSLRDIFAWRQDQEGDGHAQGKKQGEELFLVNDDPEIGQDLEHIDDGCEGHQDRKRDRRYAPEPLQFPAIHLTRVPPSLSWRLTRRARTVRASIRRRGPTWRHANTRPGRTPQRTPGQLVAGRQSNSNSACFLSSSGLQASCAL